MNYVEITGLNDIGFLPAAIIPFIYILLGGKFIKGVLPIWLYVFLIFFSIAFIVPGVCQDLIPFSGEFIERVAPEAIADLPVLISGWLAGFVVCGVALLIRNIVRHFWPNLLPDKYGKC